MVVAIEVQENNLDLLCSEAAIYGIFVHSVTKSSGFAVLIAKIGIADVTGKWITARVLLGFFTILFVLLNSSCLFLLVSVKTIFIIAS